MFTSELLGTAVTASEAPLGKNGMQPATSTARPPSAISRVRPRDDVMAPSLPRTAQVSSQLGETRSVAPSTHRDRASSPACGNGSNPGPSRGGVLRWVTMAISPGGCITSLRPPGQIGGRSCQDRSSCAANPPGGNCIELSGGGGGTHAGRSSRSLRAKTLVERGFDNLSGVDPELTRPDDRLHRRRAGRCARHRSFGRSAAASPAGRPHRAGCGRTDELLGPAGRRTQATPVPPGSISSTTGTGSCSAPATSND